MKHNPYILSALSLLLLASCGTGGGESDTVTFDANGGKFVEEATSIQVAKNNAGIALDPVYVPNRARYAFDGWYTAPSGGELYDFKSKAPSTLYAHWSVYEDLPEYEKVARFVSLIKGMCPLVSETRARVETATQSAFAEGTFYSEDNFVARRYSDVAEIQHNYPKVYYSEADLSSEEIAAGKTVEQMNEQCRVFTEQDQWYGDEMYAIYDYNKLHPEYRAEWENGKVVNSVSEEDEEAYMAIDFAAYFMGLANQLSGLLKARPNMTKVNDLSEGFGDNSYWIKEFNVCNLNNWGTSYAFAYAYTYTISGEEYSMTFLYQTTADIAFIDGKIRHCQVMKYANTFVDGELIEVNTSLSVFDFNSVNELSAFTGTKFNPTEYPTYVD